MNKLQGAQWLFKQTNTNTWFPAQVPGCNFSDLLQQKQINDPFYADEEERLQWIEKEDWEYQTQFTVTQQDLDADEWLLHCLGLDTYCDVYLNGFLVKSTNNMFVRHRLYCKKLLKAGENTLRLVFHSPIKKTQHLPLQNGFVYPAENDKSDNKLSVFTRKAPYHYGWDWGPRFVTSGIWRDIFLTPMHCASLKDVQVTQTHNKDSVSLLFNAEVAVVRPAEMSLRITCKNMSVATLHYPISRTETPSCNASIKVDIRNPKLWWPYQLGEPFLYQFNVALVCNGEVIDQKDLNIGLRTVELKRERDAHGESFFFNVNGHSVFMKGANYIPSDSFLPSVDKGRYEKIFRDTRNANMNMLRVWGGGVYEDDYFYELADKYGILIWQDFMFACTLYPGDSAFLDNVRTEAVDNLKRLRNHPCIALWCGNNEVEMGIECWEWPEKFGYSEELYERLKEDYRALFKSLLPEAVAEHSPEHAYISSSPISFWENPEDDGVGNSHYWGVWHGELPFSEFQKRIPRFMTEYGFQSFPLLSTVEDYCPKADQHLSSPTMLTHQKHPRGNGIIAKHIEAEFKPPKDFESFLYLSQLLQAQALGTAFYAHRSAMPYCMGTLYWQFNDCWPVTSWSSIDYTGRYKAAHYQARRAFAPFVVAAESIDEQLRISAINDHLSSQKVRISARLMSLCGGEENTLSWQRTVPGNSAVKIDTLFTEALLSGYKRQEMYLVVSWQTEVGNKGTYVHFFMPNKVLPLKEPKIEFDVTRDQASLYVTLVSDELARYVYVDLTLSGANFHDNFFDLVPGTPKTLRLDDSHLSAVSVDELRKHLVVRSLYDTYSHTTG